MQTVNQLKGSRLGFTLLELLIALTLLATAMTIIIGTFMATLNAWRHGNRLLEGLHHGDFVLDQLVSALRSAVFFPATPEMYGFHLESGGGGRYPRDTVSWVATGTAFLPDDSPLARGLHRLEVGIDREGDREGFLVRAFPHLVPPDEAEGERWLVSTEIKGLECRVWIQEDENWSNDWEFTNSLPRLVEITLYLDPIEEYGDPVKLVRVVEIPLGSHEDMGADVRETAPPPGREGDGDGARAQPGMEVRRDSPERGMERP